MANCRVRTCAVLALMACASGTRAELVFNGGFETATFSGWAVPPFDLETNYYLITGGGGHAGTYWARLSSTNLEYIRQTLPTTTGQDYLLSFWLRRPGNSPSIFRVRFEGQLVFNQSILLPDSTNWWQFTVPLHANQTGSPLEFGQSTFPNEFQIDDISVVLVPAPSVAALIGMAGLAALGRRRLRR